MTPIAAMPVPSSHADFDLRKHRDCRTAHSRQFSYRRSSTAFICKYRYAKTKHRKYDCEYPLSHCAISSKVIIHGPNATHESFKFSRFCVESNLF
jgi:hypothetical protein